VQSRLLEVRGFAWADALQKLQRQLKHIVRHASMLAACGALAGCVATRGGAKRHPRDQGRRGTVRGGGRAKL
jgi:hypothetical protein